MKKQKLITLCKMGYPKKNMRQQLHNDKEKIPNISSQLLNLLVPLVTFP